MRGRNLLHALQRLQAALGLASLGGLGPEAIYIRTHVRDFALLLLVGGLLPCEALGPNPFECAVVAGVQLGPLLLDIQDACAHPVKKVPVM